MGPAVFTATRAEIRRQRITLMMAPGVLVIVAVIQIARAHVSDLTPWKGGGFGMFSTVDSPSSRFLRYVIVTAEGEERVRAPAGVKRLATKARAVPTKGNLAPIAKALAQLSWVRFRHDAYDSSVATVEPDDVHGRRRDPRYRAARPDEPPPSAASVVHVIAIRVELWRYHFDADTGRLYSWKHADVTQPVEAAR